MGRAELAKQANAVATLSRRGGAPCLSEQVSRDTLIDWIRWADANADVQTEFEFWTTKDAWEAVEQMIEGAL